MTKGTRQTPANNVSNIDTSALVTPGYPVPSPSGKFVLNVPAETISEVRHWRFTISTAGGADTSPVVIFTASEAYRTRDALFVLWDDRDRVWVYRGDVGTFFWERVSDQDWRKGSWSQDNTPVPPLLKQLRPRQFNSKP